MRRAAAATVRAMRSAMRSRTLAAVLLLAGSAGAAPLDAALDGDWAGTLSPPGGGALRLVLHVARGADGALSGTLDSVDQGATIAVDSIRRDGRRVSFALRSPPAQFEGTLDEAGREVAGEWRQGGGALPLSFRRSTSPPEPPPELWEGKLEMAGGVGLRIVLRVVRSPEGLRATMDSPDQGALGIPVDAVGLSRTRLTFTSSKVGGSFSGALNAAGDEAVGQFTQVGASLPLTLRRTAKAARPARPQTPQPPFPYRAEEVSYENAAARVAYTGATTNIRLAGTLLIPEGAGPFPAVLLLTGSGPQDRDESLLGHKPFWVLADALARRGIAVLRVDDRGVGASTGDFSTATTEDFADDALAGLAFLRTRKELDGKRLGLVGHSEGGLVAPMVAARTPVAFLVLLAAPGVPGDEIILSQGDVLARAQGKPEAAVQRMHASQRRLFDLVKQEKDVQILEQKARPLIEASLDGLDEAEKRAIGDRGKRVEALLAQLSSPWLRFFVAYDPRPALTKLRCPVLALAGEKDLQVPAKRNLEAIAAALAAGKNRGSSTRALPGLNHLFQTAKTGSPTEYASIEETFSPAALRLVGDWVLAHAKR